MEVRWAYGVTTVPQRSGDLLPRTLRSLKAGGFPKPRLFVDGWDGRDDRYLWATARPGEWELDITPRWPLARAAVSWTLALYELVLREPAAHYYALFQDDLVTCRGLREYLEWRPPPEGGYGSLYAAPSNFFRSLRRHGISCPDDGYVGWYASHQLGRGALALVFGREAALTLLGRRDLLERPADPGRGWRSLDGGVVEAMKRAGYKEYIHSPGLVFHTGKVSTIDKRKQSTDHDPDFPPEKWPAYYDQTNFPGEDFDLCTYLPKTHSSDSARVPAPAARGVAVYERFPEECRAGLVADWERERAALEEALAADRQRLRQTSHPGAVRKLTRVIGRYTQQLEAMLGPNDPPYLTEEGRRRLSEEGSI